MPHENAPRPSALRLAAASVLLALAFLALAGARPLNVPDEGRYAEVAREMVVTGDYVTPRLDFVPFLDKPALFYWLDAAGIRLFGATPFGARFATALLGALGCAAVLAAGARLSGRRAGLLGAVVLAATPLWYGGAQYVNHDLAVAAWITAATLALAAGLLGAGRARAGWLLAGGVASGLALLTKGLIGVLFPFGVVGLWLLAARRWRLVPWLVPAGLVALAVAAPWYLACQRANPDFFHYFFVTQHFERFTGKGFNNPTGPAFYLLVVPLGLLPWTAALPSAVDRAWRACRADRTDARGDLLLLLWPILVVAFFSIPRSKIVGYVLPAIPPLAMLLGRWWDERLDAPPEPRRGLALGTAIPLALLGAGAAAVPWVLPLVDRSQPPAPAWAAALLVATGLALVILAALAWRAHREGAARRALLVQALASAVLIAGLLVAVPGVVRDGTRGLAARIEALRRDGDAVLAYRRYPYDLPFLLDLRAPLPVVEDWDDPAIAREDSWRRELWLGRGWRPESQAWLVKPEALSERCGPGARCFVVARERDVAALRASLGLEELAREGRLVLLASPAAAR
ncbi:MAG TPA: glycosyltransferase family 39 protein [Anaeromyxobacteraceae bacterium]|nr:glycosyltransferase family 39 protein [Anaeromyxobacteraceae bacterium]